MSSHCQDLRLLLLLFLLLLRLLLLLQMCVVLQLLLLMMMLLMMLLLRFVRHGGGRGLVARSDHTSRIASVAIAVAAALIVRVACMRMHRVDVTIQHQRRMRLRRGGLPARGGLVQALSKRRLRGQHLELWRRCCCFWCCCCRCASKRNRGKRRRSNGGSCFKALIDAVGENLKRVERRGRRRRRLCIRMQACRSRMDNGFRREHRHLGSRRCRRKRGRALKHSRGGMRMRGRSERGRYQGAGCGGPQVLQLEHAAAAAAASGSGSHRTVAAVPRAAATAATTMKG